MGMTLTKAIEIIPHIVNGELGLLFTEFKEALLWGEEALKREQYHRSCNSDKSPNLFPGETKE